MKHIAAAACSLLFAASLAGLAGCTAGMGVGTTDGPVKDLAERAGGVGAPAADAGQIPAADAGQSPAADVGHVITGLPGIQPADHEGRFEAGGYTVCVACHSADEPGGKTPGGGAAIPADHYVAGDISLGAVDPVRNQCLTCHPVFQE